MNYGETLAFWYLRLNGFFPLRDFVLHRGEGSPYTSDCDLLAIRFPHVFEEIGGQQGDWDSHRFSGWGLSLDRPIVLVVQVKTGSTSRTEAGSFDVPRLRMALRRIGLWDINEVDVCTTQLQMAPMVSSPKAQIAKLLVASSPHVNGNRCFSLPMTDALSFIRERFDSYRETKQADRLYFNDELIQFLASTEGMI